MNRPFVVAILAILIMTAPAAAAAVDASSTSRLPSAQLPVVQAEPGEKDPTEPPTTPVETCINTAVEQEAGAWVCMGNVLSVAPTDGNANGKWTTRRIGKVRIKQTDRRSTTARSGTGDYYDTWCENGSICTTTPTDYISETKGNGAYGNADGAIGSFDQILRTELNGRSQRLRGTWYWDSGPSVEFKQMKVTRYNDDFGPDDVFGSWFPDANENGAFTVSINDRKDVGRLINTPPLGANNDGDYYATIEGTFTARGIGYRLGQLRGKNWKCNKARTPDCYFP